MVPFSEKRICVIRERDRSSRLLLWLSERGGRGRLAVGVRVIEVVWQFVWVEG